VALLCVWLCFCCTGECVRDCRGLGLSVVGTADYSAGDDCVGARGSVVTGWRIGGGGENRERVDVQRRKE
jgi:hypothetical protein